MACFVHDAQIRNLQDRRAWFLRGFSCAKIDFAADHESSEFLLGGGIDRARGDHFAVAHHRDAIGDFHDFIEFVRDEHDGAALVAKFPQHGEKLVLFLLGEHGCGLVEDQHSRVAIEKL